MPFITVEGYEPFETKEGTKLVLALEDNGVDILHRCGGNAKCTTCQVNVISGDAGPVTAGEKKVAEAKGLDQSVRLSCQIRVSDDLTVKPLKTVTTTGMDPGPRPER